MRARNLSKHNEIVIRIYYFWSRAARTIFWGHHRGEKEEEKRKKKEEGRKTKGERREKKEERRQTNKNEEKINKKIARSANDFLGS